MMENKEPFKRLFGHALVRDEKGEEMHKSAGNAIWFDDAAEKMGVDVMRWIYCRHNPEHNLNFGYTVGDEIRNRVFLTWWNSYAFFTNYAILDDFTPNGNFVPVEERQLIDRWILSDLQLLVKTYREGLEDLDIMNPMRTAERFIDNLSNWYIRRNRRRFWRGANDADTDKRAAYLTLYEVLTTLARLLAPLVPFVTESMYQNLEKSCKADAPLSVHHCDYPVVDEKLIDEELSRGINLLIDIVSAGRSARNKKKIGVRQPLREIVILSDDKEILKSARDFKEHVLEELNIKEIRVLEKENNDLLKYSVKPNFAVLGPKFGQKAKEVANAITEQMTPETIAFIANDGDASVELSDGSKVLLSNKEVFVELGVGENFVHTEEQNFSVVLNIEIDDELKSEGFAREIVRHIQNLRKDIGLEIEDRIMLKYDTKDGDIIQAFDAHGKYIAGEVLATSIEKSKDSADEYHVLKIKGKEFKASIAKS